MTVALRSDSTLTLDPGGLPQGFSQISAGPLILAGRTPDGRVVAYHLDGRGFISSVIGPAFGSVGQVACQHSGSVFVVRSNLTVARWVPRSTSPEFLFDVQGLSNVVRIAANRTRLMALLLDGSVRTLALTGAQPPVLDPGLQNIREVAVGNSFWAALRGDGTVVAWGDQLLDTSGVSNVVSIAAGDAHLLALRSDGTVVAWGDNRSGQASVPPNLRGVVAIGAGPACSMAITTNSPPILRSSPPSQFANPMSPASFAADAFGSCPLSFQWSFNGRPIPGATGRTLSVWPIRPEDEGLYTVRVSNPAGYARSAEAELSVNPLVVDGAPAVLPGGVSLSHIVTLAAGVRHTVALRRDGSVIAWGANESGQSEVPPGLKDVIAAAAGAAFSMALRTDGSVVTWGDNSSGQCAVPAGLGPVQAIAAGVRHALAILRDGSVAAWGSNLEGGCDIPVGLSDVISISGGQEFSAAVRRDGTVSIWGRNPLGLLTVPDGLNDVREVAAGWYHVVALKRDGSVVAWGENREGEILVPAMPRDVVAVRAGDGSSVALRSNGVAEWWGSIGRYPSGNVAVVSLGGRRKESLVSGPSYALVVWRSPVSRSVLPGERVTLAVEAIGPLPIRYQWFKDGVALLGQTAPVLEIPKIAPEDAGAYWVEVKNDSSKAVSAAATLGVLGAPAGTVWGWGSDFFSQRTPPVGLDSVRSLAAGDGFSVAVRQDGTVVAWGDPSLGRTAVPVGLSHVRAVAAGEAHGIALHEDGTVSAWGDNQKGQTAVPSGLDSVVAVSAGGWHSLALREDGSVVAWGGDEAGAVEVPNGLRGVVAMAAGGLHSLALKQDGTVTGWGANQFGQAEPPPGLSNVIAIAAGYLHSVALRRDGTVVCWGRNSSGQCTPPADLTDVVAIDAGDAYSVAVRPGGHLVVWGSAGMTRVPPLVDGGVAVAAGTSHALILRGPPSPRLFLQPEPGVARLRILVSPGWRYHLEDSTDARVWRRAGGDFIASSPVEEMEVPSPDAGGFLRLSADP